MECDYCERTFEKGAVSKVIRGKKHTFCSEYCFILHFWKIPKLDHDAMYKMYCPISFSIPDIRELIEED